MVTADSSFAALELLDSVRAQVTVMTRSRLDAALYGPAPERAPRQTGRPRKKGRRLPTLKRAAGDAATPWQAVTARGWYGEPEQEVELATGTCVWYHTGLPAVPIRWVLVRDPREKFETPALLSTEVEAEPRQILEWFVRRWQMAVTFEEARSRTSAWRRNANRVRRR